MPSQGPQQASGRPEVPPQPSHTPPCAPAHVTPNQPQQDLIVIADSPQLPNVHPPPQDLSDDLCDDVADAQDAVAAATQPGKRQRRQLLDSSSDSDGEAAPTKAARTLSGIGTGQVSDQTHAGQAHEDANSTDHHHAMGGLHNRLDGDIIPDSSMDVGGVPEQYEDYGCEPAFEEDYEASLPDPVEFDNNGTDWAGQESLQEDMPSRPASQAGRTALDTSMGSPSGSQPMEIDDSPDAKSRDGKAAGSSVPGSSSSAIKATEALFNPPFTTLSSIAEYVPHMPPSEFPMTLRINGKLGSPLCTLQFKDSQGHALEQYSIDMELQDATSKSTATVGHDILLQAVGELYLCKLVRQQISDCFQIGCCTFYGCFATLLSSSFITWASSDRYILSL